MITAGQASDIGQAQALVGKEKCDSLLADKGYDSNDFRQFLACGKITPVIPGRVNRLETISYDKHTDKERNAVERFFGRIKEFRRIATRYDKTAIMFKGALLIASIFIWIL